MAFERECNAASYERPTGADGALDNTVRARLPANRVGGLNRM